MCIEDKISESCSLWDYQIRIFFSPQSLIYALVNILYIYYVLARIFDPPPCCNFDGRDHFDYAIDAGFIIFLVSGGVHLVRTWLAARQEHQEIMADVAAARAVQAGGEAWSIAASLDDASFFVRHQDGACVFLADTDGGTRVLDIIETEDDPRLVLMEGTMKPRDWRWRQLPGSSLRSAFVTSGPYRRVRTYTVSHHEPLRRLFEILKEATPILKGAGFDLAVFADPPGRLERRIAALDTTAQDDASLGSSAA